ncbi:MAG: nucleotide exchange factor GrpE [Oscillospiraceae bacterium]|jgi:molecular chaperone GrpE|nr:nucleotide exchange factor GrpE [Oscillospiraceae bacterium]
MAANEEEIIQASEETALDPVVEELKQTQDQLLRLAAEFDNYKKRMARERDEYAARVKGDILKAFLPVMDNLERACCAQASLEDLQKGVTMVCGQLAGALKAQGAEPCGAPGDVFDPTRHSAVMHVEDPQANECVVDEVFTKGYLLGDKIIREAVVKTRG